MKKAVKNVIAVDIQSVDLSGCHAELVSASHSEYLDPETSSG